MKKSLIIVLVSLSVVGLIFFQILWLKSIKKYNEDKLQADVIAATEKIKYKLFEQINLKNAGTGASKSATDSSQSQTFTFNKPSHITVAEFGLAAPKKNQNLFSVRSQTKKFLEEIQRISFIKNFSKPEVDAIVKSALDEFSLQKVPFEYTITNGLDNNEQITSSNKFYVLYDDTLNNIKSHIELTPPALQSFNPFYSQEFFVLVVPNTDSIVLKGLRWFIIAVIAFTIIITTAFIVTLHTLIKQKKISEMKNDFINNMTHEFKTPLASISIAVDALKNSKVRSNNEQMDYYTSIIKDENKRMNKQVETILQAAQMDRDELQVNIKPVSATYVINEAVDNVTLPLQEKNGTIQVSYDAKRDLVLADELHFTNVITNLLENAIKYAKPDVPPKINIKTTSNATDLKIVIEDNGIGMNKETLHHVFDRFYRAHTGNVHNVKGFGLGLSYVKTMMKAQKGNIKADSILGKGSQFTITLPLMK